MRASVSGLRIASAAICSTVDAPNSKADGVGPQVFDCSGEALGDSPSFCYLQVASSDAWIFMFNQRSLMRLPDQPSEQRCSSVGEGFDASVFISDIAIENRGKPYPEKKENHTPKTDQDAFDQPPTLQ